MRVDSIGYSPRILKTRKTENKKVNNTFNRLRVISLSDYKSNRISFTGNQANTNRNKSQMIFIGAEANPWTVGGGTGIVMKDFGNFTAPGNEMLIIPYYGADTDKKAGTVTPRKNDKGEYVINKEDKDIPLELIAKKEMQWGKDAHDEIMLFREKVPGKKKVYFVFTDATAQMKHPYESSFDYKSAAKREINDWYGDPYAKFSKAAVEFIPAAVKDKGGGFNPATVVCSDSQTAYVIEYMAKKAAEPVEEGEINEFDGIKPTYAAQNLNSGYCGETTKQNMFVNLGATPAQIAKIESDPIYQQKILGDEYFKPFVEKTLDDNGTASPVMIAAHYTSSATANGKGYSKAFTTSGEEYAKSIAENPQTASNLHNALSKLYAEGRFTGILNPMENTSIAADKKLPNYSYNQTCIDNDGGVFIPFDLYPHDITYESMRQIKNHNKYLMLKRLEAKEGYIISGNSAKGAAINTYAPEDYKYKTKPVRSDLTELIKNGHGDDVPLIVNSGSTGLQNGQDIALSAFEKFAKTKEGKNAIFILRAELGNDEESNKIKEKLKTMYADPELEGRIVHIDGLSPEYALASAADAAIFASRFEPWGSTDYAAMKYYCTPIVVNTQGLKQKNFDPRIEGEKNHPTSYKTTHEFNLLQAQVEPIINAYVNGDKQAMETVKKEYPAFHKTVDGKETYDESAFVKFANSYKDFVEEQRNLMAKGVLNTKEGWDKWNNLSKEHDFRFKGFARDLKDDILAEELADSLSAMKTEKQSVKEEIFKNQYNLQTGWRTNQTVHPSGKSSHELYEEIHFAPDYSKPEKQDILAKDTVEIANIIEARQHDDMKSRVAAYMAGSLTGLTGLLFAKTKNSEYKSNEKKLLDTIDSMKKELSHLKNRQRKIMIFTGAIAAAAAGISTFIATRKYYKEKFADGATIRIEGPKGEIKLKNKPEQKEIRVNISPELSMNNFKNGLNNHK